MSSDPKTLDKRFLPAAAFWFAILKQAGLNPTWTSCRRSRAEQQVLYSRAKAGKSKYPAALPGTSLHEWGLAFDMVLATPALLEAIGPVWQKVGLGTWGGHFSARDPVHFEANAETKKKAGWVKGAPYEPGLEPAWNPLEIFMPMSPGLMGFLWSAGAGQVEDWLMGKIR